jgi:hypothetical protein
VLRGDAGVGKSALLDYARGQAGGMHILGVSGVESERPLAFAALHRVVRPLRYCLEHIPSRQADAIRCALGESGDGEVDRFLVSLATLSLLAEAAERRPLLLLVDNAHLLDEASADALAFAARRIAVEGVVVLFAARQGGAHPFEAPDLPELWLGGLDHAAAASLLEDQAPRRFSPELRDRIIEETCGNPLALIGLPSLLDETQRRGADPAVSPIPVGAQIERAYLERVRRLPQPTQSLLLVVAADNTCDLSIVLRAAGGLNVAPEALDPAEQAGLVHVASSHVEFHHPLVRSAVYHAATLAERRAAHGVIADVIDGKAHADRRAWHRAAATIAPDPAVVAELVQAAEPCPGRTQDVDRDPGDRRREIGLRRCRLCRGGRVADPGFLDRILGLADAAKQPVGDREQKWPQLLELLRPTHRTAPSATN